MWKQTIILDKALNLEIRLVQLEVPLKLGFNKQNNLKQIKVQTSQQTNNFELR